MVEGEGVKKVENFFFLQFFFFSYKPLKKVYLEEYPWSLATANQKASTADKEVIVRRTERGDATCPEMEIPWSPLKKMVFK